MRQNQQQKRAPHMEKNIFKGSILVELTLGANPTVYPQPFSEGPTLDPLVKKTRESGCVILKFVEGPNMDPRNGKMKGFRGYFPPDRLHLKL